MIIAVTEKWSLRPACGEFMEITTQDDKEVSHATFQLCSCNLLMYSLQPRSIIARVVDLCGGCIPEVPHADLSKAAFSKLYDLDVGRVRGREYLNLSLRIKSLDAIILTPCFCPVKMRRVGAPKRWSNKLYGPKVL